MYCPDWVISNLGYYNVIFLKDSVLFITGILVGIILNQFLVSKFLYKIQKYERLDKVTSLRFEHKGNSYYFVKLTNFWQSLEFLVFMVLSPFVRKYDYILEDNKRTRLFAFTLLIIFLFLITTSLFFISHPIVKYDMIPNEWR